MKNSIKKAAKSLGLTENYIKKALNIDQSLKKSSPILPNRKWINPSTIEEIRNENKLISAIILLSSERIKGSNNSELMDAIDEISSMTKNLISYELEKRILNNCSDFLLEVINKSNDISTVEYFCKPWSLEVFKKAALNRWLCLASTSNEILKLYRFCCNISKQPDSSYIGEIKMRVIEKLDESLLKEIPYMTQEQMIKTFKKIDKFGKQLDARKVLIQKVVDLS